MAVLTMVLGAVAAPSASAAPGDSTFQTFTSSGTFTVPAGVTSVDVLVVGAGGSGGAGSSQDPGGGGGGAMVKYQSGVTVTGGAAISVTVGAASGGSSSFAADSAVTAAGGSAGGDAVGCVQGLGGDGYTGTSFTAGFNFDPGCNLFGGYGGGSSTSNSITGVALDYGGGGAGGMGYQPGANGAGAYGYGGGGGGLSNAGRSGGGGVVIVRWIVPNDQKAISAFSFATPQATGTVDAVNNAVAITVPYATNVTALVATFTLSSNATAAVQGIPQVSGTTANDFTAPLTYVVTAQDGTTQNWTVTVTIAPDAPVVTAVSPGTGPVVGGISVYVDGTNLSGATSVTFGGTAGTITHNTSTRITVTAPTGYGTKNVTVTTDGGSGTLSNAFTYSPPTITSIAPSSGPVAGAMSVQVNGTNLTYATGVTFGGVAGTITSVTDTRVTVTTPPSGANGAVDVVVTASGPETVTSSGGFTYTGGVSGPMTFSSGGFGSVAVGSSNSMTVTVTNTGDVRATPSTITSAGVGVTVTGGTCSTSVAIAASASCTVVVTWSPAAAGTLANASLTVAYPDGASPNDALALSGTATGGNSNEETGGGSSGGQTDAVSTSTPSQSPTATPVMLATPTVVVAATGSRSASVPGYTAPTRIRVPGTTVLVPRTLFTGEGTQVTARATIIRWMTRRAPGPQDSALGARIVRNKNGRVSVITTGKRPIIVTLVLRAPATATSEAYRSVTRWRVR